MDSLTSAVFMSALRTLSLAVCNLVYTQSTIYGVYSSEVRPYQTPPDEVLAENR